MCKFAEFNLLGYITNKSSHITIFLFYVFVLISVKTKLFIFPFAGMVNKSNFRVKTSESVIKPDILLQITEISNLEILIFES